MLGLLALGSVCAPRAHAQTTGTAVQGNVAVKIDGEQQTGNYFYIDREDCGLTAGTGDTGGGDLDADAGAEDAGAADAGSDDGSGEASGGGVATIEFDVQGLGTKGILEIWATDNPDTQNCHSAADRTTQPGNDSPNCRKIDYEVSTSSASNQLIELPATKVADDGTGQCRKSGRVRVYFIKVENPTPATGAPSEPYNDPIWVEFTLAVAEVDPPENVTAGKGNTEVTISWDPPASVNNPETKYDLIFDISGCGAASKLKAGASAPSAGGTIEIRSTNLGATTYKVNPADIGLTLTEGQNQAAVAVVARPFFGNAGRSAMSELACVERVDTAGFIELHEAEAGPLKTCSASPGRSGKPWAGYLLLLGGIVLLVRAWRSRDA